MINYLKNEEYNNDRGVIMGIEIQEKKGSKTNEKNNTKASFIWRFFKRRNKMIKYLEKLLRICYNKNYDS